MRPLLSAKIAAARLAAAASRRSGAGGGTTIPGRVLLRLEPDALALLGRRLPLGAAVVSATNGKTTTARLAAQVLGAEHRLCHNRAGANLASGVASALLASPDAELGLFEVDEAALPAVSRALAPRALVLGNLFRDQLDRYGELELVAARWSDALAHLPAGAALVRNADDPLVASLAGARGRGTSFGVDDPSQALPAMQHASDSKWCAVCGHRLSYDAVYLGHLGAWRCEACGNRRPVLDLAARELVLEGLEGSAFTLAEAGGSARVRLRLPGLYNVYNALAAAALARALGVPLERIAAGLERADAAFGRFERVSVAGREAVLLLVKNPAGANEVIRTLTGAGQPLRLLLALNDRIADGRDVSWIWDVDFEALVPHVGGLVTAGTRAAEMALRMKYAGLEPGRAAVVPALAPALDRALALPGEGPAYLVCTYTAMLDLRGVLTERGIVRPFWEAA